MMKRIALVSTLILVILTLPGCLLLPIIEGMHQMGVTSSDRQALLSRDMKLFQDALYWGSHDQAMAYTAESSREDVGNKLRAMRKSEKIVESQVESVNFSDESYTASVSVAVKYYSVPYYVVNERSEEQVWRFELPAGWRIVSMNAIDPA